MKPATAAAIARRIAIDETQDGSFVDDCRIERYVIPPEGLYEYLLTGDRPLRVMEAYRIGVGVRLNSHGTPYSWVGVGPELSLGRDGITPAAAILACAEALEEGNA